MYAAKAEHMRAKAIYRQAKDDYQIAFRALQAAKARLGDAQLLYDNAFRDAYADWCARRLGSGHGDHLQAVRELARIRGVSVRQMTRLLGYRAHRTSREVADDLHRYRIGTPVLAIARERGISRQAVYDRFRAYKLKAMRIPPSVREGLDGEIRGQ
jgi:AraC-like DNA-binding protein